jgi:hypothetical protein
MTIQEIMDHYEKEFESINNESSKLFNEKSFIQAAAAGGMAIQILDFLMKLKQLNGTIVDGSLICPICNGTRILIESTFIKTCTECKGTGKLDCKPNEP